MEDGVLSPATMLGVPSDSAMDLDFMDEIFLQGCWLETREGSEFLNQTTTNPLFDPLFSNSNFDTANNGQLNNTTTTTTTTKKNPSQKASQEHQLADVGAYCGSDWGGGLEAKGSTELSRSLWIGPSRINVEDGSSSTVVDKLCRALMSIKDVIRDKSVLVQIWVPVNNRDGRRVLTTRDLPFAIDDSCQKLARYRDISVKYQFLVDDGEEVESSKELLKGLPGRVFSGKVPEWTPDVRFFRKDEYPRLRHAQLYDVRGTLALPVFEQGSKTCLGVIEVVTTAQNIKYRPELESVCKALEAFDLKSSEVLRAQNVRVYSKYYQAALPEIQDVLRSACKTHGLPLAQTWVPCVYQGKEGCRHSDENFIQCVSTVDHACYVADPRIQGFHEACSEHHLFKGQGIVGSAFMTNQPCFSADITSYAKTEYPLSHHAMVFGLHAAVAIRLRSIQTGVADFVLEFFLPVDCTNPEEQMKMLTSLSLIIQQCCCTLRVVTDKELEEEESELRVLKVVAPPSNAAIPNNAALLVDVQQNGALDVPLFKKEKLREASALSLNLRQQRDLSLKPSVGCVEECSTIGEGSFSSVGISKTGERRRTKAEKTITLQVLRQYFAGSLKDAAKSIGVCSTTLKRICRQHGIKRWPSRKIKKVGHSLQKLQLVIDSVQGASGAFQIDSFYSNFPELASPNVSGTCPFSASKPGHNHPKPSNMQPEGGVFGVQANATTSKSSSSCSQSSSSSQCCTSRSQQQQYPAAVTTWNVTSSGEDQVAGKNSDGIVLKRVRSEAGLNSMCNEDNTTTKITMPRSQSQRSLLEHQRTRKFSTSTNNNPPVLKSSGGPSQEGEFQRVKVTFGDEKTRFRMHNNRGFGDLQREIARRFGIEDMGVYTIKYLDDDSEWVLLTCEADLEECFEVCRTSQINTIKLSLQVSRHVSRGCLGFNGPP